MSGFCEEGVDVSRTVSYTELFGSSSASGFTGFPCVCVSSSRSRDVLSLRAIYCLSGNPGVVSKGRIFPSFMGRGKLSVLYDKSMFVSICSSLSRQCPGFAGSRFVSTLGCCVSGSSCVRFWGLCLNVVLSFLSAAASVLIWKG